MKKRTFLIYVAYVFTKTLAGLTLHPYKSIIETLRRPILLPVILTPFVGLLLIFIAGKIASILIALYGFERGIVAIILSTIILSILLWQALLLYLLISFALASWKKS